MSGIEFFVERRKKVPGKAEQVFTSPSYVSCLAFVADYGRAAGPHTVMGMSSVNNWYVRMNEDGDYQTLRIAVRDV